MVLSGCRSLPELGESMLDGLQSLSHLAGGGIGFGAGFGGSFEGNVDGVPARLELSQTGPLLDGRAELAEAEYRIVGTVRDGRVCGRMVDLRTLHSSPFEAELQGAELVLLVPGSAPSPGVEPRRFAFRRSSAGELAGAHGIETVVATDAGSGPLESDGESDEPSTWEDLDGE
jgi:hypothetical protein